MSEYWWKIRYTLEIHRRTRMCWKHCWQSAGAMWCSIQDGHLNDDGPIEMVSVELSYWED